MDSVYVQLFDIEKVALIKALLEENSGEEVTVRKSFERLIFESPNVIEPTRLTLRMNRSVKRLTIAVMELKTQRQGTMTKILEELELLCAAEGFEMIVAEATLTEASRNFCEKHGFFADYAQGKYLTVPLGYKKCLCES